MNLKCVLICQLLALLLVERSVAMSCMPCHMVQCSTHLQCPGGKVTDACGCCPECTRVKNQECGGPYNYLGVFDQGLECVRSGEDKFISWGVCQETFIEKLKRLGK